MSAKPQFRDPFAYGRHGAFSAWAMAIAFATLAVMSFAIDQAVSLSPDEKSAPSLLHPVQLIESLFDAASD